MIRSLGHLNVANGGKNGYERVRFGQGTNRDKWQGYTKGKKKTTGLGLYNTAEEAAVELAQLEQDIALGLIDLDDKKPARSARSPVRPRPPAQPALRLASIDRLLTDMFRLSSQPRQGCPSRTR